MHWGTSVAKAIKYPCLRGYRQVINLSKSNLCGTWRGKMLLKKSKENGVHWRDVGCSFKVVDPVPARALFSDNLPIPDCFF